MDTHVVRLVIGSVLALAGAATLVSSLGKPPTWDPTFFGLRPRGLGGRDRVRMYALLALVLGAAIAIFLGVMAN